MSGAENKSKGSVIVGMSGGVDSAVAAWLLKRDGYAVTGLFMHNWEEEGCPAADDWRDVRRVCEKLDIECYSVNFAEEYAQGVFEYFLSEYRAFRTPNPDVLCNRVVKFGAFRDYCKSLGAEKMATGHYCGVEGEPPMLMRAADGNKDQTYFLNQVKTEQLRDVIFPLAGLKKPEVREIAKSLDLSVAEKKDSTGVCFIGERKFKKFLANYLPAMPGDIVDTDGKRVGRHDGLMYYTLGQRRGLGIGGVKGESGRWFVLEKDVKDNKLVVSCGDESALYSRALTGSGLNIIGDFELGGELKCTAKTRYRQPDFGATLRVDGDKFTLEFDEPQRAVTPGQYAVIYLGDRCLGGGVIESPLN